MFDVTLLKAQIRSILLALGRGATEREFRREYYEIEGKSFNEVIQECGFNSIVTFLSQIPDVCRLSYTFDDELFIQRVSSEETRHMDKLTIVKKRKKKAKTSSFRPFNRYNQSFSRNISSYRPPPNRLYNQPPPRLRRQYPSSPNVLRPANYQNFNISASAQYRPAPVVQRTPVNPSPKKQPVRPVAIEIPLHMKQNVERVVYKKPVQPPEQSKSVETLPLAQTTSKLSLGSEKVVYRKDQKVASDGENAINEEMIEISSSEYETDSTCSESSDHYFEENKNVTANAERKVKYDEASEAKITITINQTPPRTRKSPNDIRLELSNLRKRVANLKLANGDVLSHYITSAEFQIPKPNLEDNPPWFDIKILGVESPEKFTFQFDFPAIEELQNSMKQFYDGIVASSTFIVKNMAKNMVVAVLHSNRWYRAKIVDFDTTTAQVIPLDCLTLKVKTIPRTDVFYLHKKFTEVSQKSGYGKIFGIMPIEDAWKGEATAEIAKLKSERRHATVKKVENNVYYLSVIVENKTKFRIIDVLMEKNLITLDIDCFMSSAMNTNKSLK